MPTRRDGATDRPPQSRVVLVGRSPQFSTPMCSTPRTCGFHTYETL